MTPSGAALLVATVATGCLAFLLFLPQPVEPTEWPALHLDRAEAQEAIRRLEARCASPPTGEAAEGFRAALDAYVAARVGAEANAPRRRRALRDALAAALERGGPDLVASLRSEATCRALRALALELSPEEELVALGEFARILSRYRLSVRGELVAPRVAIAAIYGAHFNRMVGLSPIEGLEPIERRAYWGWLAFHAPRIPEGMRRSAIEAYAEEGGRGAEEALAMLAYRRGRYAEAFLRYRHAFEERGELRLRNHALMAEVRMR